MAVDTKELIAQETKKLIDGKKLTKLTVRDIVDACHITRQTFYYHFSDIPELLKWMMEQRGNELFLECGDFDNVEEQIRHMLLIAVNARPMMKKGLESKYGEELENLLLTNMQALLHRLADKQGALQRCTPFERDVMIRYHCQAIMGLVRHWSEEDTKNLDGIAHAVFLIVSQGMSL